MFDVIHALIKFQWLLIFSVCVYVCVLAIFWDSGILFIESSVPTSWSFTVRHVLRAATLSALVYRLVAVAF